MRKRELDTPALLVDLAAMERNLCKMGAFFREGKTTLRPHFKSHQSPVLSAKQLETGAVGITCATVDQAEVLVDYGIRDVLIANEVVGATKIKKLAELSRCAETIFAVDNVNVVADLAREGRNQKVGLGILVDVDVGLHRCGVCPGEGAARLARTTLESGLSVRGVVGYEGHLQLVDPGPDKCSACEAALKLLLHSRELIESWGVPCPIVSAGGTGTYSITGRYPGITEVQAGTYATMDTSYVRFAPDFEPVLGVLATVISKTAGERVVVDSGKKALSGERGLPSVKGYPDFVWRLCIRNTQLSSLRSLPPR